jgi:hypothetical protein
LQTSLTRASTTAWSSASPITEVDAPEIQVVDVPLTANRRTLAELLDARDTAVAEAQTLSERVARLDRAKAGPLEQQLAMLSAAESNATLWWSEADDGSEPPSADAAKRSGLEATITSIKIASTGEIEILTRDIAPSNVTVSCIRLRQGKTGRRVVSPVGAPLKAALDATPRRAVTILTTQAGLTWTSDGFSASWRKAVAKAGIRGLTFHDLRGTAVLRLALASSTVPEIATITGHSIRDVQSILDANYFHRDVALAESAIRKLERHRGIGTEGGQISEPSYSSGREIAQAIEIVGSGTQTWTGDLRIMVPSVCVWSTLVFRRISWHPFAFLDATCHWISPKYCIYQ